MGSIPKQQKAPSGAIPEGWTQSAKVHHPLSHATSHPEDPQIRFHHQTGDRLRDEFPQHSDGSEGPAPLPSGVSPISVFGLEFLDTLTAGSNAEPAVQPIASTSSTASTLSTNSPIAGSFLSYRKEAVSSSDTLTPCHLDRLRTSLRVRRSGEIPRMFPPPC